MLEEDTGTGTGLQMQGKPGKGTFGQYLPSTKEYLINAFKNLLKVEIRLPKDESYGKFVEDSDIKVTNIQERVRENIKKAQERQKNDYRKRMGGKGKQVVLSEGQLVLLYMQGIGWQRIGAAPSV